MTIKNVNWMASAISGFAGSACLLVWLQGGSDSMLLLAAINFGLSLYNTTIALRK